MLQVKDNARSHSAPRVSTWS